MYCQWLLALNLPFLGMLGFSYCDSSTACKLLCEPEAQDLNLNLKSWDYTAAHATEVPGTKVLTIYKSVCVDMYAMQVCKRNGSVMEGGGHLLKPIKFLN